MVMAALGKKRFWQTALGLLQAFPLQARLQQLQPVAARDTVKDFRFLVG